MATEMTTKKTFVLEPVGEGEDIEVTLRPLPIYFLRKFYEVMEKIPDSEDPNASMDVMLEGAVLCIQTFHNDIDSDTIEQRLDLPTTMEILSVCGQVDFSPNQTVPAATR